MKKIMSFRRKQAIVCIVAFAIALIAAFFMKNAYMPFVLLITMLAAFILIIVIGLGTKKEDTKHEMAMAKFYNESDKYAKPQTIPTVITDSDNRILNANPAFYCISNSKYVGHDINEIITDVSETGSRRVRIGEKEYVKEHKEITLDGDVFNVYRFVDEKEVVKVESLYKTMLGVVAIIQVDNYDELMRSVPKAEHSSMMMQLENIVAGEADSVEGLYQQFGQDKYLMVFERRKLATFIANKFDILRRTKLIETSVSVKPTISMGVGARSTLKLSMENAAAALDMAQSRGGDQAVIKERQGYKFYGGGQQAPEMRVRVKARMFSKKLRNLMDLSGNVLIMGHKVPDLDCMGAALGIAACARYLGKPVNIILDESNAMIDALVSEMKSGSLYSSLLISSDEAERLLSDRTLLCIVDTQIRTHAYTPSLIKKASHLAVIDHHLRGTSYIEKADFLYHEPYASSASEMVCELVQYFSDHLHLQGLEAEALLAGIMIDTKGFSYMSGARTFEAAAFLKKNGADTTSIRHLFQDDLKTYSARSRVVQGARIIRDGIAVAECPENEPNSQLLAAQAADSLLGIRGIDASFVFSRSGGMTNISGRSIGHINVQRILEKLGGGGHSTMSGAQIKADMKMAEAMLESAIDEYLKEG